jgi:hypothetical protein
MPEGPMNVAPVPVTEEVETQAVLASEGVGGNASTVVDVPAGQTAHFPTHAPRLTSGGQAVLNALRPQR